MTERRDATIAVVSEVKQLQKSVLVACRAAGATAMPSRRKQQKPRHVDADDEDDDVQPRPSLDVDDDDDDAGKSTSILAAYEMLSLLCRFPCLIKCIRRDSIAETIITFV